MAQKRSFIDDLATGLGEGLQLGAKIGQIRAQNQQQEKAAEIERMKMAQKKFDDDYNHAYNAGGQLIQFANQSPMTGTKAKLYAQYRTLMQPYMTSPMPDLAADTWGEVSDEYMKKASTILKQKSVSKADMRTQLEELSVEATGKLGAFKENLLQEPSVEEQKFGMLNPEEQKLQAVGDRKTLETEMDGQKVTLIETQPHSGKYEIMVAGGKPVVGETDTVKALKSMPSDMAGRFALSTSAIDKVQEMIPMLFPDGNLDKGAALEAKTGVTPRGQKIRSAMFTLRDAVLRPRTGAAAPDSEQVRMAQEIDPTNASSIIFGDSDSAEFKLNNAMQEIQAFISSVDPQGKYREAIKQGLVGFPTVQSLSKKAVTGVSGDLTNEELTDHVIEYLNKKPKKPGK